MNCNECVYKGEKCSVCSVTSGKGNNYFFTCFNKVAFISTEEIVKQNFNSINKSDLDSKLKN